MNEEIRNKLEKKGKKHPYYNYYISENGDVWYYRANTNEITQLKKHIRPDGYVIVNIFTGDKLQGYLLHILVWVTYNGKYSGDNMNVDHIDNNRQNNNLDNLKLITKKQNVQKAARRTRKKKNNIIKPIM